MHVSSGRWLYGFLLALTTTLLWGVLPIMLKQVLQVMDPYTVTWYRLLSAGLVLFCWLAAKRRLPSIMALSRQKVPAARTEPAGENLSARGAYELRAAEGGEDEAGHDWSGSSGCALHDVPRSVAGGAEHSTSA